MIDTWLEVVNMELFTEALSLEFFQEDYLENMSWTIDLYIEQEGNNSNSP